MAGKPTIGDFKYKVILLGNHGVGKTSIFRRIKENEFFDQRTASTLGGVDIHQTTRKIGNDTVTVDLWDTGGAERFRTITDGYYRQTAAAILLFAVDDQTSCFELTEWMENALHYIDRDFDEVNWIVWGNKCDLPMPEVGIKEAKNSLSNKYDTGRIKFNIVSAKTGKNVESLFSELIESTHNKATIQTADKDVRNTVDLGLPPKKRCC